MEKFLGNLHDTTCNSFLSLPVSKYTSFNFLNRLISSVIGNTLTSPAMPCVLAIAPTCKNSSMDSFYSFHFDFSIYYCIKWFKKTQLFYYNRTCYNISIQNGRRFNSNNIINKLKISNLNIFQTPR